MKNTVPAFLWGYSKRYGVARKADTLNAAFVTQESVELQKFRGEAVRPSGGGQSTATVPGPSTSNARGIPPPRNVADTLPDAGKPKKVLPGPSRKPKPSVEQPTDDGSIRKFKDIDDEDVEMERVNDSAGRGKRKRDDEDEWESGEDEWESREGEGESRDQEEEEEVPPSKGKGKETKRRRTEDTSAAAGMRPQPVATDIPYLPACFLCLKRNLPCVQQEGHDNDSSGKKRQYKGPKACFHCAVSKHGCMSLDVPLRRTRKTKTPAKVQDDSEEDELDSGTSILFH